MAGLQRPSRRERKAANTEKHRIHKLERELKRKDKALAEAAALLMLKNKVREIWGDEDDDTTPESDGWSGSSSPKQWLRGPAARRPASSSG
jgi:hypothetical protein